jgi:hypothetical protein
MSGLVPSQYLVRGDVESFAVITDLPEETDEGVGEVTVVGERPQ